jgi:hypothetical protein
VLNPKLDNRHMKFISPVTAASSTGRCNTIWYKAGFKGGVYDSREAVWAFGGAELAAPTRHVRKLPAALRRSLTWDRGLEMAKHKTFTVATDVKVYFCDPQSPWQRGSNENTNGLLRQYFPKRTDLSGYTQSDLDKVALRLNQRPRKTPGFQTPASALRPSVASTH